MPLSIVNIPSDHTDVTSVLGPPHTWQTGQVIRYPNGTHYRWTEVAGYAPHGHTWTRIDAPVAPAPAAPKTEPNGKRDSMTVTLTDDSAYIDAFLYCIERNYPYPLTVALLAMVSEDFDTDDTDLLVQAWEVWKRTLKPAWAQGTRYYATFTDKALFLDAIREITDGEEAAFCDDCDKLLWADITTEVQGERRVCDDYCSTEYYECWSCNELARGTHYGDGHDWCDDCFSEHFNYCEDCDEHYHEDYASDHDHSGCLCDAPHTMFEFPANGDGVVEQNERLTVDLPKGTIDEAGMDRIKRMVWEEIHDKGIDYYTHLDAVLQEVGTQWQGKRGNFTRRLSSALFKAHKIKLTPETISEIGNLARQHSSSASSWKIEFTRDLNMSAGDFCHDDSCWWGGYFASRCALKNWGGLGMRSFDGDSSWPTGRVWVMPLRKENLRLVPTHDTLGADAYVVFNAYGELSGYIAARIVAHLTGMTYKKVGMSAQVMYVNNNQAVLVSDEETCKATTELTFHYAEHDKRDANTQVRLAA